MKTTSIIRVLTIVFFLAIVGIFLSTDPAWANDSYSDANPDIVGNSAVLTGIEIGGVEAPKAGETFDTSATVTAKSGETWEIPVFWLGPQEEPAAVVNLDDQARPLTASDGSLWKFVAFENEAAEGEGPSMYAAFNVVTIDGKTVALPVYPVQNATGASQPAEQGVYYRPLLVFSVPDGKTSSGMIALDSYLAGAFNMSGGIISIPDRESGITYITGMVRASTLTGILNSIGSVGAASAAADKGTESEASVAPDKGTESEASAAPDKGAESEASAATDASTVSEAAGAIEAGTENEAAGAVDTGAESEASVAADTDAESETSAAAVTKPKTLPPLDPTVIRPAGAPEFPFDQETYAR